MVTGLSGVTLQVSPSGPTGIFDPPGCSVRDVIDQVGDTSSVPLVVQLREGPVRFSALLRGTEGISRRMLTRTLRLLERDGLVSRTVVPTTPPQVFYALNPLGRSLVAPLAPMTPGRSPTGTACRRPTTTSTPDRTPRRRPSRARSSP